MESSTDGEADDPANKSIPEDGKPPTIEVGGVAKASTVAELDDFDFEYNLQNATEPEVLSLRNEDMKLMDSGIATQIRAMVRKSKEVDLQGDENDAQILAIFQERFMRPVILGWVHNHYKEIGGAFPADDDIWKAYIKHGMLPNFEQRLEPVPYERRKRPRRTKAEMEEARARESGMLANPLDPGEDAKRTLSEETTEVEETGNGSEKQTNK